MRFCLLLAFAVCALLPAQAAAQFDFRTAWGRHTGWGVGPGYHAYSQCEINNCSALGYPHEMGCTACTSPQVQKETIIYENGMGIYDNGRGSLYENGWGSNSDTGQPANALQRFQTMTPRVPTKRVPGWSTTGNTAATDRPSVTVLTRVARTNAGGPNDLPIPHVPTSNWWKPKSGSRPNAFDQSTHRSYRRGVAVSATR